MLLHIHAPSLKLIYGTGLIQIFNLHFSLNDIAIHLLDIPFSKFTLTSNLYALECIFHFYITYNFKITFKSKTICLFI